MTKLALNKSPTVAYIAQFFQDVLERRKKGKKNQLLIQVTHFNFPISISLLFISPNMITH